MSPFDLIETDPWPRLKQKLVAERMRRIEGLMRASALDALRKEQGFIEALDWVLDEARPQKPQSEDVE